MSLTIGQICPPPRSRTFICGSTGSGKSTLLCTLLEEYRRLHPLHPIYILDPKTRFFPVEARNGARSSRLFPNGSRSSNHGRSDGVSVHARLIHAVDGYRYKDEHTFLVQDEWKASQLFDWLYRNHDVRRPALVAADESLQFLKGVRADPGLRRLLQQGREKGVGVVLVNQRPAWIDATFLSEADRVFAGRLYNDRDRKRIAEVAPLPDPRVLLDPIPAYHWWLLDQQNPERSRYFHLQIGA